MSQQTINTVRFGDVQVDTDRILTFVEPILGFGDSHRFVILDHAEDSPFKWLQSADEPALAFVVTNPRFFGIEYEFALPDEAASLLNIQSADDALVLTIVNIPQGDPGKMTANLLGPVVINQANRRAMQVVLSDTGYSTKTRLIPDEALTPQQVSARPAASED